MIIYEINSNKRTVIARFKKGLQEGKEFWRCSLNAMCWNILQPTHTQAPLYMIIDKILDSQADFVGKATCHEDDEWDEEKGKQIAKAKLLKKWNKIKEAVLWRLNDSIVDNYRETMKRLNKKLLK